MPGKGGTGQSCPHTPVACSLPVPTCPGVGTILWTQQGAGFYPVSSQLERVLHGAGQECEE